SLFAVNGTLFKDNRYTHDDRGGGAIYIESVTAAPSYIRNATFDGNSVTHASADGGGAIYLRNGTNGPIIRDNVFVANTAPGRQGGAVRVHGGSATITGGRF